MILTGFLWVLVVFTDGRFIKVEAVQYEPPVYHLILPNKGWVEVPESRVTHILKDEIKRTLKTPSKDENLWKQWNHFSSLSLKLPYGDLIEKIAKEKNLNPLGLAAIIQVESAFDPRAFSPKGAMGLMQLMPGTASLYSVADPWDPEENLRGGAAYLNDLMKRFSPDIDKSLAAYNAGPSVVEAYDGVPPFQETLNYLKKVKETFRALQNQANPKNP